MHKEPTVVEIACTILCIIMFLVIAVVLLPI